MPLAYIAPLSIIDFNQKKCFDAANDTDLKTTFSKVIVLTKGSLMSIVVVR